VSTPAPTPTEAPAETFSCTVSVSCAVLLSCLDELSPSVAALVPESGWLLPPTEVTVTAGESVFDVLLRLTREQGVHMEYSDTPLYNSAYIEGIGNLYEMDAGGDSGWMYRVNGWFPNYGCSRYTLESGDTVEWLYTRNLGVDIGGSNYY